LARMSDEWARWDPYRAMNRPSSPLGTAWGRHEATFVHQSHPPAAVSQPSPSVATQPTYARPSGNVTSLTFVGGSLDSHVITLTLCLISALRLNLTFNVILSQLTLTVTLTCKSSLVPLRVTICLEHDGTGAMCRFCILSA